MNDQDAKDANSFQQHQFENRGSKSIMLLNSNQGDNLPIPADAESWDFTGDKV